MEIRIVDIILTGLLAFSSFANVLMIKRSNTNKDVEKCYSHAERLKVLETKEDFIEEHFKNIEIKLDKIFDKIDKI